MNQKNNYVHLPETNFAMKADLPKREEIIWPLKARDALYEKVSKKDDNTFVFHDGPPYANGSIHLGHAADKIYKDIVNKAEMLLGRSISYIPGWDCHGLPIEINVEKKFGRAGDKLSKAEFAAKCRSYAREQIDLQKAAFQRLGILADWDNYYATMQPKYEANVIRALAKIIANGYVERGFKPVYWCTACGSALAEAEVEYINKTSPSIDVRFRSLDNKFTVPIWTTTPWTLPANEAVALHPEIKYAFVFVPEWKETLIIAEELVPSTMQRYAISENAYQIQKSVLGKELEHKELLHPFLDKKVPIILGDHVGLDAGTGAVHTAPAHGQDDFRVGEKYNLPVVNPVDAHGKFKKDVEFFAGESVFNANEKVIELLRARGNLLAASTVEHSYPHCWRHKKPLIFRATEQWFIKMGKIGEKDSLRQRALEAIEHVAWLPKRGLESIRDMLTNRPDWCISRQRTWGTPMALFLHKESAEMHPETLNLLEQVAIGVEHEGIEFWHNLDEKAFLKEHAPQYSADDYVKSQDTLDVWFDSGVSHFCVLKQNEIYSKEQRELYPESIKHGQPIANIYLEGGDQYRGWFQSSLLTALALYKDTKAAPYFTVITHGMTVDAQGRKMSKSLGNVMFPEEMLNKYGADIMRLWASSLYMYDELAASPEILQRVVDVYRLIRNTARYALGNMCDFDPNKNLLAGKDLLELDRFAVRQMLTLQEKAKKLFSYEYMHAEGKWDIHLIFNSLAADLGMLSNIYFSTLKDRLYTMSKDSLGRRSAQTALFHILQIIARIIAPVLSFTAEEIWQEMLKMWQEFPSCREKESVLLNGWYEKKEKEFSGNITDAEWFEISKLRADINQKLEEQRLPSLAKPLGHNPTLDLRISCSANTKNLLEKFWNEKEKVNELRFIFNVSSVEIKLLQDGSELSVEAKGSEYPKCNRCWYHIQDVGSHAEYPEFCGRCVKNIEAELQSSAGEERIYV
ncbi:MAG: isoleucine--tRNA ligase [Gammaproteobacteria bacterium]